mgnify:CR=1 FL=1
MNAFPALHGLGVLKIKPMKQIIFVIIGILALPFCADAQYFLQYAQAGDQNYLSMHICTEKGSETVDSTYLTVSYRLTRKRFDNSEKWTIIRCQYGHHIVLQTDMWLLYSKQQINGFNENIPKEKQIAVEEKMALSGNGPSNFFVEMIYDNAKNNYISICGDYFENNRPWQYEERDVETEWVLQDSLKNINGYVCSLAHTEFRGRTWSVWYAPEIPVNMGPWKFNGLPGLILWAADSNLDFVFECQTISQQPEPIELNIYESRNVSREKYLRYERLCHEQPYVVASSGQPALVRVPNGTGGYIVLTDKNWTIPYNSIERE